MSTLDPREWYDEDEERVDARWFDGFPDEVFHPDLTGWVYRRCRQNRASR